MLLTPEELRAERQELNARLAEIEVELQALCQHTWHRHQIAGEGQICYKCGARNFDCDD